MICRNVTRCLAALLALATSLAFADDPAARARSGPALTDPRGEPLPEGVWMRLGDAHLRHAGFVSRVAFSADGKTVASAGADGAVCFWDASTGKERRRRTFPEGASACFAFAPDGKTWAMGGSDGAVHIHAAESGDLVRTLRGQPGGFFTLAFSSDGKALAAEGGGLILVWDPATGEELRRIDGSAGPPTDVHAFALSADGKTLASSGGQHFDRENEVRLWDVETGKQTGKLHTSGKAVGAVAFSPDAKTLATAGYDGTRIWDLATGKTVLRLPNGGTALAFSPDGATLAAGGIHHTIYIWQVDTGKEVARMYGRDSINSMAFSPDGKNLASGNRDGTVRLWDPAGGVERPLHQGHQAPVLAAALSPGGKLLVSLGADHSVRLWETAAGKEIYQLDLKPDPLAGWVTPWQRSQGAAFSPDGKTFAVAGDDGCVHIWETAGGKERPRLSGHDAGVTAVAFSPDGKVLASASWDGTVRLWDADGGREVRRLVIEEDGLTFCDPVQCIAFAPDGKTLAAGASSMAGRQEKPRATLRLYDVGTGKQVKTFGEPGRGGHSSLAFSPDGRLLFDLSGGKTALQCWDAATGSEVPAPESEGRFLSLALSPDGQILAAVHEDGSVHLWETISGKEIRRMQRSPGKTTALAFSADGLSLACGGADGVTLLYDLPSLLSGKAGGASKTAPDKSWADLGSEDVSVAYRALAEFAGAEGAAAFLKARLKPGAPADSRRIGRLVADLDANDFDVREAASRELEGIAAQAAPALRAALRGEPSPEVRRRANSILETLARRQVPPETLRQSRALQALERVGGSDARAILRSLANGPAEAALTGQARGALAALNAPRGEVVPAVADGPRPGPVAAPPVVRERRKMWGHEVWTSDKAMWDMMGQVSCMTFSPDGKVLASAGLDGTVRLWDAAAGKELRKLTGHEGHVLALAFSPDGKLLASAGADKVVRLWDPAASEELRRCTGHTEPILTLAFSPDGKLLASGSADHTLRLWDPAAGKEVLALAVEKCLVESVSFSPDGAVLAAATGTLPQPYWKLDNFHQVWADTIRFWDPATGKELHRFEGRATQLAFSADGKTLAAGGVLTVPDKLRRPSRQVRGQFLNPVEEVHVWDAAAGKERLEAPGSLVGLSPNGKILVVHSSTWIPDWGGWQVSDSAYPGNDTLCLVDASTGTTLQQLPEESAETAAFSPDGAVLATAAKNGVITLWSLARTGANREILPKK